MVENLNMDFARTNEKNRKKELKKQGKRTALFSKIEPQLLTAIRNGDHQAYSELYLANIDPMIDFLNLLLHSRDMAEEISQQIFVHTWENRQKIDPESNFRGYLYKMAKTAAFKHMAHQKVKDKYKNYKLYETPDFHESPDEIVISKEMTLLINISLENMPAQRRKVFEMSRAQGLTNDEIAQKLNISKNTVRTHLYNAMKELRELLTLFIVLFL